MDKFNCRDSHYIRRDTKADKPRNAIIIRSVHLYFNRVRMDNFTNKDEQDLKKVLGSPKYYIDTPGKTAGEDYYWFPNQGDSMTDNTTHSIPGGSLVLGRLLSIKSITDIPLHRPMVFIIDYAGEQFCLLKSPCEIKTADTAEANSAAHMLCLRSYNPAPGYDDLWLPFQYVKYVFVVERVRRPDGSEFVPDSNGRKFK